MVKAYTKTFIFLFFFGILFSNSLQANPDSIYSVQPDVMNCKAGVLKDSVKQWVLEEVNMLRAIHGLKPVQYKYENDNRVQQTALMFCANADVGIDRQPPSSVDCYDKDASECSEFASLYTYDISGYAELTSSRDAIKEWIINDRNEVLADRRALLNPFIKYIAFGRVDGPPKEEGTLDKYCSNALDWNIEFQSADDTDIEFVAYPYHQYPPVYFDAVWRLSFAPVYNKTKWENNVNVDYSNVKITMEVAKSGTKLNLLSKAANNDAYGAFPHILTWKADGIVENIKYLVTIENVKVNGEVKDYSYWFNLSNTGYEMGLPETPVAIYPEEGATDVPTKFDFEWQTSENANGYFIQVAKTDDFIEKVVDDGNTTPSFYVNLEPNTTYYWRITAGNGVGKSDWTEAMSFTTDDGSLQVPDIPELQTPENNSTDQNLAPMLFWRPLQDIDSYDVQVSINENFTELTLNENVKYNMYQFMEENRLQAGTKYYWRVRAVNTVGKSKFSDPWNFTTKLVPPEKLTITYPQPDAEGIEINPILKWNPDPVATSYEVQVSEFNNFSDEFSSFIKIKETTYGPSYRVKEGRLNKNTNYFWRVRGINNIGNGEWSEINKFRTAEHVSVNENILSEEDLLSNYPNPFNGNTIIQFILQNRQRISIKVYNSLGTEIATVVNDFYDAGIHKMEFDGKDLPSGIYYYILTTSDSSIGRKMEIIK